jgi:precorrin-3B synthase
MNAPHRRLACPSIAAPMATGDGYLARLVLSGKTIELAAFTALCAAARAHGNGIIEITARGNIQVRGLAERAIASFAADVEPLGIATAGVPISVDPLAGLDPNEVLDARALGEELRGALMLAPFAARLGPKVCVAIDGGSTLHLDQLAADVRLRGTPSGDIAILVGGDGSSAASVGLVHPTNAVETALRALAIIADHGPTARARDLVPVGAFTELQRDVEPADGQRPLPRRNAEPIGVHPLCDDRVALGIGVAFGHSTAHALESLANAAELLGSDGVRTAPGRALLVIGLAPAAASALRATAESLGFITRSDDPRRSIITCAGKPYCAAAQIPTRTLAPVIASLISVDPSFLLHLSGCAKGCAHHARANLTVVGDAGRCNLIWNGTARDQPSESVSADQLAARLAATSTASEALPLEAAHD